MSAEMITHPLSNPEMPEVLEMVAHVQDAAVVTAVTAALRAGDYEFCPKDVWRKKRTAGEVKQIPLAPKKL